MRGNHFDYLLENEDAKFFQKVAIENAGVDASTRAPLAPPMQKTASAPSSFEKVASRLERDLELLKVAGPIGVNAGMTKRANKYMDVLLAQFTDLSAEQLGDVFDKVASAAIEADLTAAYHQLCANLPAAHHGVVDDVLMKIGAEMAEAALQEKAALIEKIALGVGALGRIGHMAEEAGALGKATRGLEGGLAAGARAVEGSPGLAAGARAAGGAAKEVASRAGNAVKEVGANVGRKAYHGLASIGENVVGKPLEAAGKAVDKLRQWRTGRMMSAPERIEGALNKVHGDGAVATGVKNSLQKQLGEADAKRTANLARNSSNPMRAHVADTPVEGGTKTPTHGDAALPKVESERAKGQEAAAGAAKMPKAKAEGAPKAEGDAPKAEGATHTPEPPGGSEGKPPGFMDAWKKASTHGWKGLSAEEKGTLIRGGVTAALVYRSVTGKGAVTGGEGII